MAAGAELQADVLIVGAGPSGLMLAVVLARLGVDAIIVDGKSGPTRESRALAVQARTMELYDQLGLVDRVLAERSPATAVVPGFGSHPFGRVELRGIGEGVSPYLEVTVFEQSRNERMLVDALAGLGREVRWGHRLARLDVVDGEGEANAPAGASVIATLDGPDGLITVRARYCVGADGAHSPVREALGVPFEGVTNEHSFYVTDAAGVTGLVDGAVNIRITAEHFLLGFPMGAGRMGLLGVVRDRDLDAAGELAEDTVKRPGAPGVRRRLRGLGLVLAVPAAPPAREAVPCRPVLPGRRRRPHPLAGRRAGHEHRAAGGAQPGVRSSPTCSCAACPTPGSTATRPSAAPSDACSSTRPTACSGSSRPAAGWRGSCAAASCR